MRNALSNDYLWWLFVFFNIALGMLAGAFLYRIHSLNKKLDASRSTEKALRLDWDVLFDSHRELREYIAKRDEQAWM